MSKGAMTEPDPRRSRRPDFSRFRAAITRESVPDCVPFGENDIDHEIMSAFLGQRVHDLESYVSFWVKAGYDYVLLEIRSQFISDSYQKKLSDGVLFAETDQAAGASVGFVTDEQSFLSYPWTRPEEVYYRDIDLVKDHLPDQMKVILSIGPLYNGVQRVMGMDSFVTAYAENHQLLSMVIGKFGEAIVRIVANVLERDWVQGVWLGDDIAYTVGLFVSPVFLREFIFPYYRRVGDLCRQLGRLFIFHSDGNRAEILEDLLACGVQAIHPNEPAANNIGELKREWGDRLALIGNIDVDRLVRGNPEQVTDAVRVLLAEAAPNGGFVLGSGNSITRETPLENYIAMLNAGRAYGLYQH